MRCSPGSMKLLTLGTSSARASKTSTGSAAFRTKGHWIVISGDANIAKRKAEQSAFRNSRLTDFFFAPALNSAKVTKQMQRLLAIWDDIEAIAKPVAPGAMYELPIKGKIRQLRT